MEKESIYKDVKYFTAREMQCKCGCGAGAELMDVNLLRKLDLVRLIYDKPIVINSGFRCKTHNDAVGGVRSSSHLKGLAVDIRAVDDRERYRLVLRLLGIGFKRIGLGKGFIHVDVDKTKQDNIMWIY